VIDKATYELAEKREALEVLYKKADRTRSDAIEAERVRAEASARKITELADLTNRARSEWGRAGEARARIENSLPVDLRQAVDRARAELVPHLVALEDAERQYKDQERHGKAQSPKYSPSHPGDAYELKKLEEATEAAKTRFAKEQERVKGLKDVLARAEKALAAAAAEARSTVFAEPKKPEAKPESKKAAVSGK
jgi:hypothetical protein